MVEEAVSVSKYPRIRRDLSRLGLEPLQITSKAKTKRVYTAQVAIVDALIENSQVAVLDKLARRELTLDRLVEAKRRGELQGDSILTSLALGENLWEAMDKQLPHMGKSKETRKRYAQSRRMFEVKSGLPKGAKVNDLCLVNWAELQDSWGRSASDWMHLRRLVSAFLSKQLGDVFHPFRRAVVAKIPTAAENERVPDLTPAIFGNILAASPEYVRPAFMVLLLTGMRDRSEYLRCTKEHLKPGILAVQPPGTKNRKAKEIIRVAESQWPWIEAGIPSPLKYKRLREHWNKAVKDAGYTDLHLHDLRHALGQWVTDEGIPESKVQDALRHASPAMTRRYTRQKSKGEVAEAVSNVLKRKGA